jgi:hypothetical protein
MTFYESRFTNIASSLSLNNGEHWICISVGLSLLIVALGLGCASVVVCGASAVDWLTGRLVDTAKWTLIATDDFFNKTINEMRVAMLRNAVRTRVRTVNGIEQISHLFLRYRVEIIRRSRQ